MGVVRISTPNRNYFSWHNIFVIYFPIYSINIQFVFISSHFSYVFSAPDQLLESMPGTLMLTDCLEACQANESCGAVNYETGLCVLFSSNADKLPGKTIIFNNILCNQLLP